MPILALGPPTHAIDAEVKEEDRWLVLSAPAEIDERELPHPIRLHTAVLEAQPRALGAALLRGREILAVVHDLEREPSVTAADVERAWSSVLALCQAKGWTRVAAPPLGAVHGGLERTLALALMARALAGSTALSMLWLSSDDPEDLATLRAHWGGG